MSTRILITGANSGIGYATSAILAHASENNHVIMAGRNPSKLDEAAKQIQATNPKGKLSSIVLDVNSRQSINTAASQITEKFGALDVLVNNAGIAVRDPDVEVQLTESFRTNVIGAVLVTQAFKPLLLKSPNAYLLYISSGLGSLAMASPGGRLEGIYDAIGYRSSKAALNMVAIEDARTLVPQGIKVFAVCPGLVESNLRGSAPEEVSAGGTAISADTSGNFIKDILEGQRDADTGKFVHANGVYPW
nr:short-chain dehydrogenase/reductase trope [Quercus suber]